eukprot:1433651-Pyramimonas_sp.AAC.1
MTSSSATPRGERRQARPLSGRSRSYVGVRTTPQPRLRGGHGQVGPGAGRDSAGRGRRGGARGHRGLHAVRGRA